MGKINRLLIVAILSVVVVALAGMASASSIELPPIDPMPGLTVTADTVQTNGHYIGVPKIINGDTYTYGYNYTLVPDGTFTVTGTIRNDNDKDVMVEVILFNKTVFDEASIASPIMPPYAIVNVSAKSKATYSITIGGGLYPFGVNSSHDINGLYAAGFSLDFKEAADDEAPVYFDYVDFSDANYIDSPASSHTVDEGPMSDAVALYDNGKMSYSGKPQYAVSLGE